MAKKGDGRGMGHREPLWRAGRLDTIKDPCRARRRAWPFSRPKTIYIAEDTSGASCHDTRRPYLASLTTVHTLDIYCSHLVWVRAGGRELDLTLKHYF